MPRQEFSDIFEFNIRTLEKGDHGERHPKVPARAYLTVAVILLDFHPLLLEPLYRERLISTQL